MKNTLFGKLGDKMKGNMLTLFLVAVVGLAGFYTYRTIVGINYRLENQRIQNIETTPSPEPEETEDVQQEQYDVPLPAKPTPRPTPRQDVQTQTEQPEVVRQPYFVLPVNGKIFTAYSGDELVYNRTLDDWRTHNGVDISAAPGDAVKAGAEGRVINVFEDGMLGTVIEIQHSDFTAKYCGLAASTFVKAGDNVTQGQSIGTVGETPLEIAEESHIHLEIVKDSQTVNPDIVLK